ncbi:MAG: ROK family protein [Raoultibacter sp.]
MGGALLGIDMGGTTTKLGLFSCEGNLCAKSDFVTRSTSDPRCFPALAQALDALLESCGGACRDIVALGIAVPAVVDAAGLLGLCTNIDLDLESYTSFLASSFPGASFAVLNDASAAAKGEAWRGAAVGVDDFILVTLGTGIGAGIVVGGTSLGGAHGAAGEIGHLRVCFTETEVCGCGQRGCLEQYASATGVVRMARRLLRDTSKAPSSLACVDDLTAKEVFDHARAGDALAEAVVGDFAEALGFGLAQISCVFDPSLIVIGGGMSASASFYLPALTAAYRRHALSVCAQTPLVAAHLGNDCGIYGAALHALKALESDFL